MKKLMRRLPIAMLCIVAAGSFFASGRLAARYMHALTEGDSYANPVVPSAHAEQVSIFSRIERVLTYTSLDAPDEGEALAHVVWDDAWFGQDDTVYNHELARTASVLAALAYSESGYYQSSGDHPPYMENALSELGFSEVDTEAYRFRSQVVDEVLNLVTSDTDVVAYTVARKRVYEHGASASSGAAAQVEAEGVLGDGDGANVTSARDIIVVSVRGSYGSEWLSNLDLSRDEGGDHGGYVRAAHEIAEHLNTWIASSRLDGADVSVLLVGHSRGGAVANLVAAELDDMRASAPTSIDQVYAYTFASPATTLNPEARDARYDNIFNIANPADIMPSLPLRSWGYERYGIDLELPVDGSAGFDDLDARMRAVYEDSVGVACAADGSDAHVVEAVVSDIASQISSVEELVTPQGALEVVRSLALHVNPVRILYSHYPSTYISWMQVLDEADVQRCV